MPKPTGPSNEIIKEMIAGLRVRGRKEKSGFMLNLADLLETPERRRPAVNLSKIEREADGSEIVLVPGKVLSSGEISKPFKIASLSCSAEAARKIAKAGGRTMSIAEFLKEHGSGKGVRIIK
ncbi:MAG: 50S ribosomal protein L18e [Candidatus Aenigmatarchaeota archaeon]